MEPPPPFALAAASTNFLLVAVSVATVVVRARLATVSCWRMAVLFVAARARLLSAISSQRKLESPPEAHRAPDQEALPPQGQYLMLVLEVGKTECRLPPCPRA